MTFTKLAPSLLFALALALGSTIGCGGDEEPVSSADAGISDPEDATCSGFTSPDACPEGCKRTVENGDGNIWCGEPCTSIDDCGNGEGCGVYGYCAPVCAVNGDCEGFQGCGSDLVCALCQEGGPC